MNEDRPEGAIACSLRPGDFDDRRKRWERLAVRALRESRATDNGVRFFYTASEETECELRELARLEAECCGFAEWRLTRAGDDLVLDVTSEGEGAAEIRALFPFGSSLSSSGSDSP